MMLLKIGTTNTTETEWFHYPFCLNNICETLNTQPELVKIITYSAPYKINTDDNIEHINTEHKAYLELPDFLQDNLDEALKYCTNIEDVLWDYKYYRFRFYPTCKSAIDFAKYKLRYNEDIPENFDYNKYLQKVENDIQIIETSKGVMTIRKIRNRTWAARAEARLITKTITVNNIVDECRTEDDALKLCKEIKSVLEDNVIIDLDFRNIRFGPMFFETFIDRLLIETGDENITSHICPMFLDMNIKLHYDNVIRKRKEQIENKQTKLRKEHNIK